jgi:type IV pilus biogenesis protein CpaD/CtpE
MIRISVAAVALVGAIGAAQASIPKPTSPEASAPSDLDHTYLVFFEAGKARLTPEARQTLHVAARQAHVMHQVRVRVMVSTANGTTVLSQSRARAVTAELVRDGVKPHSIGNASRPDDLAHAIADPMVRAWSDRSAVVKISPLPIADGDRQA